MASASDQTWFAAVFSGTCKNLHVMFSDLNASASELQTMFSSCWQEEETLSFIKESLEKSDQLTKNMVRWSLKFSPNVGPGFTHFLGGSVFKAVIVPI